MSRSTERWAAALEKRRCEGLLRTRPVLESSQSMRIRVDGKPYLSFASNDYLGLASHPEICQVAKQAIDQAGFGSGASHMVSGHHLEHQKLEEELADFVGREKAIVFSSGYAANMAMIATLAGKGDIVFQDRLNHASLIDGGLLSGARYQRYLHNDADSLQSFIQRFKEKGLAGGEKLVVTDGVFSMDGDVAKLPELVDVCARHEALLAVDDAHGIGVLGEQGQGTCSMFKLDQDAVPVLVGTFGKAFGTAGAFVAGSNTLVDYLEQFARPYIYTTAMPAALAAATRKSLEIIKLADERRERLRSNISKFRAGAQDLGLNLMDSTTAIQPVVIGDSKLTMRAGEILKAKGFLVGSIRPPTVPAGSARLRVTMSSEHEGQMIDKLLEALDLALTECRNERGSSSSGGRQT